MKTHTFKTRKLLALVVAVAMMATVLMPYGAMAAVASTISTELGEKAVVVNEPVEFSVSTVPNDDAGVMVMGKFEIDAEEDDISMLEYYETATGIEGWYEFPDKTSGEFGPAGTGFPMMEATSKFRVTFANAGEYTAKVSAVKFEDGSELCSQTVTITVLDYADYTGLDAAVAMGKVYSEDDYTPESYAALKNAIEAAEMVDLTLTEDRQNEIDELEAAIVNAVEALVKVCEVKFTAVAVAAEPSENYAKADKIVIVFGAPVEEGADVVSGMSVADAVESAEWINNTVYELTLKENHGLLNGTKIEFVSDYSIKTIGGEALTDAESVVVGNLEEAEEYMTATAMTATIVKSSAKPGACENDKIVLVFNAPVYGNRESIKVNLMTAVAVDDSYTVYEIVLDGTEPVSDDTLLSFEAITDVELNGTFGIGTAPVVVAALAVENSGNALCKDDEILVFFDRPTNGVYVDGNAVFGDAVASWNDTNTILEFTLGAEAQVENGMTINLDGLGIMDEYESVDYVAVDFTLEGAFITAAAPVVEKILLVDNNGTAIVEGDQIVISFNIPTNAPELTVDIADDIIVTEGLSLGDDFDAEWNNANTEVVITLGKTAVLNDEVIFNLDAWGITDLDGLCAYEGTAPEAEGSFGTAFQPALLTLTAISKQGKGAPSAGDEIYLAFNVKMREDELNLRKDFTFSYGDYGTGASVAWATGDEYAEYSTIIITLGEGANVVPGTTKITVEKELYEESGTKACLENNLENRVVAGTFGTSIAPELLSASVVKTKSVVGPQNGDQIVLLFNVPTNGENIDNLIKVGSKSLGTGYEGSWNNGFTVYTIELGSAPTVEGGDVIEFDNDGTLKDINGQKQAKSNSVVISGSFGEEAAPVGISPSKVTATIVKATTIAGAQAEDMIVFAFNVVTNGAEELMKDFFNAQGNKFGEGLRGYWNESNTIYTLVLGENATVADGETITFTSQAGIQDKDSINAPVSLTCTLIGSFGVEITPVTVAPSLLDAVIIKGSNTVGATKGDKIQLIFNMAINNADLYAELGGENVFGADSNGAKDNNIYTIIIGDNANIPASFNITAAADLKDAAEFSEAAVIPNVVLTGSFGDEIKPVTAAPALFKAVIVKATDTVGPQAGDKIQLVFNMAINDADLYTAMGGATVFGEGSSGSAENNVYTIILGTGVTSIPASFSINSDAGLKDASGYSANAVITNFSLVGSFGIAVNPVATKPALKSAVIIKDSGKLGIHAGDKIVLIFNVATNGKDDNINLLNNIAFPGRNDETLGENPSGRWISDIEYEITLGEGAVISEVVNDNAIIKFNHHNALMDKAKITAASEIEIYQFEGSFGVPSVLKLEKAVIVKADNNKMAKAQKGDELVLSFSSKTNAADIASKLDTSLYGDGVEGEWSNDDTIYTITLGTDAEIADEASIVIPAAVELEGVDGGAFAFNSVKLEGSFGKVSTPVVISAVAYSDVDNDYIDIMFSVDTNTFVENKTQGKYLFVESTRNILGDYSVNWSKGANILTIILGNDHTFKTDSEIIFVDEIVKDVDGLGVLADGTGVANVKGELRKPYVVSVIADYDEGAKVETLTVTFSSKTNKPENIDLSAQSSSLGIGATASWTDSKTLVITLGAGRTISVNGTGGILLNGLGITNGFDTNEVVGQYSITGGTLKEDVLKVVDARVNTRTIGEGETADFLTVTFNASTDMYGRTLATEFNMSDIEANIEATHTFGTGATAKWESASKLVIRLGDDSLLKNEKALAKDATITLKNLKFANGLGEIEEEAFAITGSFDGRETKLEGLTAKVAGEYTVATVTLNKQDLDFGVNAEDETVHFDAVVTFVIWDKDGKLVTDMNSVNVDLHAVDKIELQSKFVTKEAGKVDVYVTDIYIDAVSKDAPAFNLLADTVTSAVAAQ